jgi:hypothetical protein
VSNGQTARSEPKEYIRDEAIPGDPAPRWRLPHDRRPFADSKEQIGGFWAIKAPDLDAALSWARKATLACTVPIEVRPFQDETED